MTRLPNVEDMELGNKFLLLCPRGTAGDIFEVTAVVHPNGFIEGNPLDFDKESFLPNVKYCFFNDGNRDFNISTIRGEIPYADGRYLFAIPLSTLSDEDVFQYRLSDGWDHLQHLIGSHKKWVEVSNDMTLEINCE